MIISEYQATLAGEMISGLGARYCSSHKSGPDTRETRVAESSTLEGPESSRKILGTVQSKHGLRPTWVCVWPATVGLVLCLHVIVCMCLSVK